MLNPKRKYYTVVISSYVIFCKDGKFLLTRRYNTGYRDGEYSLPAGHIEDREFAVAAALREAEEEVGVKIREEDLLPVHIMHRHCDDHERIEFFFAAEKWEGELKNMEPAKCDDVSWFSVDKIPSNVIPYVRSALDQYNKGNFLSEFYEI